MPINVKCSRCGRELADFGALAFSPPQEVEEGRYASEKIHLCQECWVEFRKWMKLVKKEDPPLAKDLNELINRSVKNGAIDLRELDKQARRDEHGILHDVKSGPCCCGGWH